MAILRLCIETIETPRLKCIDLFIGEKGANAFLYPLVSPSRHGCVIGSPGPLPRGPAPHASEVGKMVTLPIVFPMAKVVGPTDHHYPRVVSIELQHGLREQKKGWIRHAVIVEDDPFIDFGECPINTGSVALACPEIRFGIVISHVARPVDILDNCSCPGTIVDVRQ